MLSPSFIYDLETNMRIISNQNYQRLLQETWWPRVAKVLATKTRKERVHWLLDTAKITEQDDGEARFEDLVMQTYEVEHKFAGTALQVNRTEFEDLDANGVDQASAWARQVSMQAAYWPQKILAKAILANPVTYDSLAFFHGAHPVNPFDADAGTYANDFTGSASGTYPGALPIGAGTSTADAITNLYKARTYIGNLKCANGEDPRNLQVNAIIAPRALEERVTEITSAELVVRDAPNGTGGGAANAAAMIRKLGLGEPIIAPELGAEFGGSDTTYYLLCSEITSDDLGAWAYLDREPFQVRYYGLLDDAQLGRMNQLQWHMTGRNAIAPGHPFMMFRCQAT